MPSEKGQSQKVQMYGSIYVPFLKRQNFRTGKQIRDCQGLGMVTEQCSLASSGCGHKMTTGGVLVIRLFRTLT